MSKHRATIPARLARVALAKGMAGTSAGIAAGVVVALVATGGTYAMWNDARGRRPRRGHLGQRRAHHQRRHELPDHGARLHASSCRVAPSSPRRRSPSATPASRRSRSPRASVSFTDPSGTLASQLVVAVRQAATCTLTPVGTTADLVHDLRARSPTRPRRSASRCSSRPPRPPTCRATPPSFSRRARRGAGAVVSDPHRRRRSASSSSSCSPAPASRSRTGATTASTTGSVAVASPTRDQLRRRRRELVNGSFESPEHRAERLQPARRRPSVPGLGGAERQRHRDLARPGRQSSRRPARSSPSSTATAFGTLYQDVVTIPGQTLRWSVQHRGREGIDSMRGLDQRRRRARSCEQDAVQRPGRTRGCCAPAPTSCPPARRRPGSASPRSSTHNNNVSIGNLIDDVTFGSGPCLRADRDGHEHHDPGGPLTASATPWST